MDADLMRAARLKFAGNQGKPLIISGSDAVIRNGSLFGFESRGILDALCWMAAIGRIKAAVVRKLGGMANGPVLSVNIVHREHFNELFVGCLTPCDEQQTARFGVDAMDDAGARDSSNAAELIFAGVEQGIDEGVFLVADSGMDTKSGGLIDDDQMFIFVENIQRDI